MCGCSNWRSNWSRFPKGGGFRCFPAPWIGEPRRIRLAPMRSAALLLVVAASWAVETAPVPVLKVADGDTLTVQLDGQEERVRLLWVDCAETSDNAHGKAMREGLTAKEFSAMMAAPGTQVTLWSPLDTFERDRYGRILALVKLPKREGATSEHSLNDHLILRGDTVYWRKYGDAPEPWHSTFLLMQQEAEAVKSGGWASNPQWMRDKANERTAPRGAK